MDGASVTLDPVVAPQLVNDFNGVSTVPTRCGSLGAAKKKLILNATLSQQLEIFQHTLATRNGRRNAAKHTRWVKRYVACRFKVNRKR